jgi:hypothetical protein
VTYKILIMKAKFSVKIFLSIAVCLCLNRAMGQCSGCTTLCNDNTIPGFTVTTGDVLCVPIGFSYSGVITLDGGEVCNEGTIANPVLIQGILNNYGIVNITAGSSAHTIYLHGQLSINNMTGAQFNVAQDMVLTTAAGSTGDSLLMQIAFGSYVDLGANFIHNAGGLRIDVGTPQSNSSPSTYNTSLGVHASMYLNTGCIISTGVGSSLDVTGNIEIAGAGNRQLTNNGAINLTGDLKFAGDGLNVTTINLDNNGSFSMNGLISTMVNAYVTVNNNAPLTSPMSISASVYLSHNHTLIDNNGKLDIAQDLNIVAGSITNDNEMSVKNVSNTGLLINNSMLNVSFDFWNQSGGTFVNNGIITVVNHFTNSGACTFGQATYLKTSDFDNDQASSTFDGPPNIFTNGVADDVNYARIIIDNFSKNTGSINGWVEITDISLSGGGIDVLDPTSVIGGNVVVFGGGVACNNDIKYGYFSVVPNKAIYCPGENIFVTYTSFMNIVSLNWSYSGTANALYPSSNSLDIIGVQSGGVVTYWGTYYNGFQYCNFSFKITITVGASQITAPSPHLFAAGNIVNLSSTVTNATPPITYNWQPNLYFSAPSTNQSQNPAITPEISLVYTVTATDASGCVASTTVMVISQPYAHLNKTPDGGYYKLFNNKLLFKYDGQYATTGLAYKVLDKTNTVIASNPGSPNIASSIVVNSGDNRYYLNASGSYFTAGYYTLEITNEKNEKMYLRFIK